MVKGPRTSIASFFSGPPKFLSSFPRFSNAFTSKNANPTSGLRFDMVDVPLDQPITGDAPRLRRNKTEKVRLQGLMHTMKESKGEEEEDGIKKALGMSGKASIWMVNEGRCTA